MILRDGAIDDLESKGFDWALELIQGSGKTDKTLDEIKAELAQTNEKISSVQRTLCRLADEGNAAYKDLKYAALDSTYQAAIDSVTATSVIERVRDDVFTWKTKTESYDPFTEMDQHYSDVLADRQLINAAIHDLGAQVAKSAASGPIHALDDLLQFSVANPPPGRAAIAAPDKSNIVTDAYASPMAGLVDYYTAYMLLAIELSNEVYRFDARTLKNDDPSSGPIESTAKELSARGFNWIDVFNQRARNIGTMPVDTPIAIDLRKTPYKMWTQTPINLGDRPGQPDYCSDAPLFCLAPVEDDKDNSAWDVGLAVSPPGLQKLIESNGPGQLDDWKLPTQSELEDLLDPTGTLTPEQKGLQQFVANPITSHLRGFDTPKKVVGPYLVATSGDPGIVSMTDPSSKKLTFHSVSRSEQYALGGKLLLVRAYAIPNLCDTPCGRLLPPTDLAPRSKAAPAAPPRQEMGKPRTPGSTPALDDTTTYSAATTCAAGPTYVVPDGAHAVRVNLTGAAGGAGKLKKQTSSNGGAGGSVTAVIPVRPGAVLHVQVGAAGGSSTVGGVGGGGSGGATIDASGPEKVTGNSSGGGGGASGIAIDAACSRWLAVAGGGGGGGSGYAQGGSSDAGSFVGGRGGDACPVPRPAGFACTPAGSGADNYPHNKLGTGGGTPPLNEGGHSRDQTKAAYTENGNPGSTMLGGTGSDGPRVSKDPGGAGGGGGGGYFGGGGGGGGGYRAGGGGGGGGASFAISGSSQVSYGINGSAQGEVRITAVAS